MLCKICLRRAAAPVLLFLFLFCALHPAVAATAQENPLPEYTINISFDPQQGALTGSARIDLPAVTPLSLFGGDLEFSGVLLDIPGATPKIIEPSAGNTITLAAADTPRTLYMSWQLSVPQYRGGDNLITPEGITLAGLWHPLPDRDMLYRLEALLPDDFTGISEGKSQILSRGKSHNRYLSASFDHPLRSINFIAGPYRTKSIQVDGITLSAYFFEEDFGLADDYLTKAAAYLTRYQTMIGPYPYDRYSIVENRLPTGYGMPTFTLLGQAVVRLPFITDTSLGHEILHSWFGNSVRLAESGGNWVEGLTTYLADQLYAADLGEGADYRKNQLLRYASYVHDGNQMTLREFSYAGDAQPMARKVRAIGYDKGSMVFHMLHRRLGDEQFFTGLRQFYREMQYKRASWEDIRESFARISGQDLAPFFSQWLTRADIPVLSIDDIDVSQIEGRSEVTFTVRQLTAEPYELELPITLSTRSGKHTETVRISGAREEARLTVDELPLEMVIDQDYDLMREMGPSEKPAIWSFFMGASNRTVVLPAAEDEAVYAPLREMLEEDGSTMISAENLTTDDLLTGSFLFLGPAPQSLGLFAAPDHPADGFTLEVRNNPLAPREVIVLVSSSAAQETAAAARKLSHYGKYSFLHFAGGRALEKRIQPSSQGFIIDLFSDPVAIEVQQIRTFDQIMDKLADSRVIYVGETHTDMGSHILQLRIIQALFRQNPELAIGMEMFPRSSQQALDDYINGAIDEKEFLKKSEYFEAWGFDYRLYREIIGYARMHAIPIIGLNIDKAIVSQVFKTGDTEQLTADQVQEIPVERRLDMPGYRARLLQAFSAHGMNDAAKKTAGFIQAQAIWDESMAESIAGYLSSNPGKKMVVIAGNGHIYKDSGIPPRVKRRLDIPQSVVSSMNAGITGLETGYRIDYLVYTRSLELSPLPMLGLVLDIAEPEDENGHSHVRVKQISPHSKAGQAGLKENDIILAINDMAVHKISDLKIGLLDKKPGDMVQLSVLRERPLLPDQELELSIELTSPPMAKPINHP